MSSSKPHSHSVRLASHSEKKKDKATIREMVWREQRGLQSNQYKGYPKQRVIAGFYKFHGLVESFTPCNLVWDSILDKECGGTRY